MLRESFAVKLDDAYIILAVEVTQSRNECLNLFAPGCTGILFTVKSDVFLVYCK